MYQRSVLCCETRVEKRLVVIFHIAFFIPIVLLHYNILLREVTKKKEQRKREIMTVRVLQDFLQYVLIIFLCSRTVNMLSTFL